MWNGSEEYTFPLNEIDFFFHTGRLFGVFSLVPMAFHYLQQQDQRWSLTGWTNHFDLTAGILSGLLITLRFPSNCQSNFLINHLKRRKIKKKRSLDVPEGKQRFENSLICKMCDVLCDCAYSFKLSTDSPLYSKCLNSTLFKQI